METLKIVLAMLALVLIGFIGGFATHRHLSKERIHQVAKMHKGPGFMEHIGRTIRPDEAQREQLRLMFHEWGKQLENLHHKHQEERIFLIDSIVSEIKPQLRPKQIERIEKRLEGFKKRSRKQRPKPPLPRGFH